MVSAIDALIFGSDDDAIHLGPAGTSLSTVTGLASPLPVGLENRGWISEDGLGLELSDSIDKIRGHQGNAVVKEYMSSSDTNLTAALLESRLSTLLENLDATATKVGTGANAIAKIDAPSSRKARLLTGVVDLFDTSGNGAQFRILLPTISLGERQGLAFKTGEITAYNYNLAILGGFTILTNAKAIVEDPKLTAASGS